MNMIQNAKDQVLDLTVAAYGKAAAQGLLPEDVAVTPSVEIPKDTANGDYTTTFCLAAAKALKKNPRQVAQILMDHMDLAGSYFTSVEMAGPGFLNFRLGDKWFRDTVACVEREGADYGCNDTLKGQKIMVEFVSANPTGPMHMGNARGGVLGDTLASVLQKSGANVWREFYVNAPATRSRNLPRAWRPGISRSSRARTPWNSPRTATTVTISGSWPAPSMRRRGTSTWTATKRPATMLWPGSAWTTTSPRCSGTWPGTAFSTTSGF